VKRAVTDKEGKFALKHLDADLIYKLLVVAEGRAPTISDKHIDPVAGPVKLSLKARVRPLPVGPTDADLDRIFTDLDSNAFKTREKASQELAAFGVSAVPGVRERLQRRLSVEVRRRVATFLDQFDLAELSPLRAVERLEGITAPAAKELLAELEKGAAGTPHSLDAAAALTRLGKKPAGQR
jgi:hypothetical protein